MVLSVMLPSCGMRTGGDTFTEKDIQRYLNLENEKGKFLRNLYLRRFYVFFYPRTCRLVILQPGEPIKSTYSAPRSVFLEQVTLQEPSPYFRYQFAVLQWYLQYRDTNQYIAEQYINNNIKIIKNSKINTGSNMKCLKKHLKKDSIKVDLFP